MLWQVSEKYFDKPLDFLMKSVNAVKEDRGSETNILNKCSYMTIMLVQRWQFLGMTSCRKIGDVLTCFFYTFWIIYQLLP